MRFSKARGANAQTIRQVAAVSINSYAIGAAAQREPWSSHSSGL